MSRAQELIRERLRLMESDNGGRADARDSRVTARLPNSVFEKLKMMAQWCGLTQTAMAERLLEGAILDAAEVLGSEAIAAMHYKGPEAERSALEEATRVDALIAEMRRDGRL